MDKPKAMAWQWDETPRKTEWGDMMVVADFEIDKDHTVSIYCERDQTTKVEKIFSQHKEFVKLTDEEIEQGYKESWISDKEAFESAVWWAEHKLKEKNHA